MQLERYFEKPKKEKPLKPKTKKALEELYRPPQKGPKPKDELEEILAESPEFSALTPEELKGEKEILEEELASKEGPEKTDNKKEEAQK